MTPHRPSILLADQWRDYQLLETGDGMKHERWGQHTLVRPDPQIIWPRHGKKPGTPWKDWDGLYHRSEIALAQLAHRPIDVKEAELVGGWIARQVHKER